VDAEVALMRRHGIEILVTKNSGGRASVAKIEAARRLGLPVVLVRPPQDAGLARTTIDDVLAAIEAHRAARAPRGV
jgi:precorrin-6A/cobalt-precorrin-6A reductase